MRYGVGSTKLQDLGEAVDLKSLLRSPLARQLLPAELAERKLLSSQQVEENDGAKVRQLVC